MGAMRQEFDQALPLHHAGAHKQPVQVLRRSTEDMRPHMALVEVLEATAAFWTVISTTGPMSMNTTIVPTRRDLQAATKRFSLKSASRNVFASIVALCSSITPEHLSRIIASSKCKMTEAQGKCEGSEALMGVAGAYGIRTLGIQHPCQDTGLIQSQTGASQNKVDDRAAMAHSWMVVRIAATTVDQVMRGCDRMMTAASNVDLEVAGDHKMTAASNVVLVGRGHCQLRRCTARDQAVTVQVAGQGVPPLLKTSIALEICQGTLMRSDRIAGRTAQRNIVVAR